MPQFKDAIQVIDNESSAVVFAYNVKKGNFQSAADAFAKHFKKDYLDKRSRVDVYAPASGLHRMRVSPAHTTVRFGSASQAKPELFN